MIKIFLFSLLLTVSCVLAQNPDWQTITNMNNVRDITVFDGKVWAVSDGGAFVYDPIDDSVEKITNIDGLRSVNLRTIITDNRDNIIFGSAEGYLQTFNPTDSKWTDIRFDGTDITDFYVAEDTLWVASGSGVAVFVWLNDAWEYNDFFINFPQLVQSVNSLIVYNNRIWLGTDIGLLSAPSDFDRVTLTDPQNWLLQTTVDNLPGNEILSLAVYDGLLWIGTTAGLAYQSDNTTQIDATYGSGAIAGLNTNSTDLIVLRAGTYFEYNLNDGIKKRIDFSSDINTVAVDPDGKAWIALREKGLRNSEDNNSVLIDGPAFNNIRFVLKDASERIWASSGKFRLTPNKGYSVYEDEAWWSVDFSGTGWSNLGNTTYIYEDNFANVWLGTWGGGIEVLSGNNYSYFHTYSNSGARLISTIDTTISETLSPIDNDYKGFFVGAAEDGDYEVISTFKEDFYGRLWIVNSEAYNEIYLAVAPYANGFLDLNKNNWTYFGKADGIDADIGIIAIEFDDFGRVWIGSDRKGVYVLDYNNTLNNKADDQVFHLDLDDNLYSNTIKTIAKDQDGIIWLGSDGGLNSFDGVNIFKHVGDENGFDGPLNTTINQIVVDEFNNKWIATAGGISILRNGKSPFEPGAWIGYNSQNSGLVNDNVHSVFVDNRTSEAIIGTENGLSLFRGSFAETQNKFNKVIAGPNPFILNESTLFTIKKLKDNSIVKIFDLSGTLIRKLSVKNKQVDGSRAIWDGEDSNGNPVATGIYLFLAYAEDGSSYSGKVAVIRK